MSDEPSFQMKSMYQIYHKTIISHFVSPNLRCTRLKRTESLLANFSMRYISKVSLRAEDPYLFLVQKS